MQKRRFAISVRTAQSPLVLKLECSSLLDDSCLQGLVALVLKSNSETVHAFACQGGVVSSGSQLCCWMNVVSCRRPALEPSVVCSLFGAYDEYSEMDSAGRFWL